MKPVKVMSWYLGIGLIFALVANDYVQHLVETTQDPKNRFLQFEQRLAEFNTDTSSGRVVFLGPSYAHRIGKIEGAHNLGTPGQRFKDSEAIAALARPNDHILYFITIREMMTASEDAESTLLFTPLRRLKIARDFLQPAGLQSKPVIPGILPDNGVIRNANPDMPDSIKVVKLQRIIVAYSQKLEDLDVSAAPFKRLCAEYPNMVIVLHPVLKLQRSTSDTEIAKRLNKFIEQTDAFYDALFATNLPIMDMRDSVPQSGIHDYFHLNPSGKAVMRSELSALIKNL